MTKRLCLSCVSWLLIVTMLFVGATACSPKPGASRSQPGAGSAPPSSDITIGRFRPQTPLELQAAPDSVDVPIRLVELVYPVFPSDAPCVGTPGGVLLGVAVGADSVPTDFGVVQTDLPPECQAYILTHLMDVVRRSTFWPALKSGSPVASVGVFPVRFWGAPSDTAAATGKREGGSVDTSRG